MYLPINPADKLVTKEINVWNAKTCLSYIYLNIEMLPFIYTVTSHKLLILTNKLQRYCVRQNHTSKNRSPLSIFGSEEMRRTY